MTTVHAILSASNVLPGVAVAVPAPKLGKGKVKGPPGLALLITV